MIDHNEVPRPPYLSITPLESVFPRTFYCLAESEKIQVTREFARSAASRDLQLFPDFLEERKWASGRGFVPDLARLEFGLRMAGLAPDVECEGFESVTTASEPEWYAARFRFDPAHRILESDWPLDRIYVHPQGEFVPAPGTFLTYRSGGRALFRALSENESLLIRSLSLGVSLGRVLDRSRGPEFDAMTFHRWIESGLLRAIDWARA